MSTNKTCQETAQKIRAVEMPLCCPNKATPVWNMHPRVYLTPDDKGFVECPYCSAKYQVDKS